MGINGSGKEKGIILGSEYTWSLSSEWPESSMMVPSKWSLERGGWKSEKNLLKTDVQELVW